MKANGIEPGMVLKLKRDVFEASAHADGTPLESDLVTVTKIKPRPGYSVPWILSGQDAFKPSDFARFAAWAVQKTDKFNCEANPMTIETVMYGLPKGATERYEEVLLLTNATPELIEKVKVLAGRDGFHSFRIADIDLSSPPDFRSIIQKAKG